MASPSGLMVDYAASAHTSATAPQRLFPAAFEQDQTKAAEFRPNSGSTSSVEAF
jgi:hypothetical protein